MESQLGYRIAGEGKEVFDRFQIRDRIRAGEVTQETQLSLENSDDYRAAAMYPELARYFSLVGGAPVAASPGATVMPAAAPVQADSRLLAGLAYPFTGAGGLLLLIVTGLQLVPIAGWIASAFVKVYQLEVIRSSAKGSTTMPPLGAVGEAFNAVMTFLKILVVGICSLWPVVGVIIFMNGIRPLFWGSILFTLLYAPASFAVLAKTDSIAEAVNPSNVIDLMRTLGRDFVIASVALAVFLVAALFPALGIAVAMRGVPGHIYIASGVRGLITEWGFFYYAHLVGWAMYRRG
jgi:hypothetical protein